MEYIDIDSSKREEYNRIVNHALQSFEWGEFREKTGVKVIRRGLYKNGKLVDGFSLTIHKIPKTNFTIGYLPKGNKPTKELLEDLKKIGKENNCIFIQLEPNLILDQNDNLDFKNFKLRNSFHPLFTKFTFVLDLNKSEEELLKSFHSKTRYNIKVAQKHGVKVEIDNSENAFKEYLKLTKETTTRQKFFAHTPSYHTKMWETLKAGERNDLNKLSAHLLKATFENETLVTWILFSFKDYLYYPYGASSVKHRNVMASNLTMWEAIKLGRKMGLKYFDMWGALGENPDPKDSWFGFHKFKEGYGAKHTEFVGSYDLVLNPILYKVYMLADKARWVYLRLKNFN